MAAMDFFTAEVLTWKGPVTYYVLFFIHWESRRICVSGMTRHPDQEWMEQQARAVSLQEWGFLAKHKYRLQDRDAKFCPSFRQLIETDGRKTIVLPARSPNLNAYAERWVRSVKQNAGPGSFSLGSVLYDEPCSNTALMIMRSATIKEDRTCFYFRGRALARVRQRGQSAVGSVWVGC
jgi:hypothetical protein